MKQQIPKLVVLTAQTMGCMFPTEDFIRVATIFIWIEVDFKKSLKIFPEKTILQTSLLWDYRKGYKPLLLYGNGV